DKVTRARIALPGGSHRRVGIGFISLIRSPRPIEAIFPILIERSWLAVIIHAAIHAEVAKLGRGASGVGTERRELRAQRRRELRSELLKQWKQPRDDEISPGATGRGLVDLRDGSQ